MKNKMFCSILVVMILLTAFSVLAIEGDVYINPASSTAGVGEQVSLTVVGHAPSGTAGTRMDITFNPTVLEVVSVGSLWADIDQSVFDNTAGTITILDASFTASIGGLEENLAAITFNVLAEGTSTIDFTNVEFDTVAATGTLSGATVTVGGGATCGDSICDGNIGENYLTCPADCDEPLISNGLMGYWNLDNDAMDYSGQNNHGTAIALTPVTGHTNGAYDFDGVGYIDDVGDTFSYSFVQNSGEFTISAWIKLTNYGSTTLKTIIANTPTTYEKGFIFAYENSLSSGSNKVLRLAIGKGTGGTWLIDSRSADNTITDNNWHHVVAVGDGTNVIFYVDNVPQTGTAYVNNVAQPGTTMGTKPTGVSSRMLEIGRYPYTTSGGQFDGIIDEVMIFKRALNADEVNTLFTGEEVVDPSTCPIAGDVEVTSEYYTWDGTTYVAGFYPQTTMCCPNGDCCVDENAVINNFYITPGVEAEDDPYALCDTDNNWYLCESNDPLHSKTVLGTTYTCQNNLWRYCDDGSCDPTSENCLTCPADCGCPAGETCTSGVCLPSSGDPETLIEALDQGLTNPTDKTRRDWDGGLITRIVQILRNWFTG